MNDNQPEPVPFEEGLADLIGYNPVWFWIISFIVLSIVMITMFFLLRLKNKDHVEVTMKTPMKQASHYVAEIDKTFLLVSNRAISIQEACQRVSITLREYIQQQTGLPASSMTFTDLQSVQTPEHIMASIQYIYPIVFGNARVGNYDEFLRFMNSSRAILDGRWNR